MPDGETSAPRTFISYSHDSPEHLDRVLALANRLRAEGVDAMVDQYEPAPREGWPRWTERQIDDSDFVLLICTGTYLARVQNRDHSGKGRGVLWEATLIYNRLYSEDGAGGKFIPVLLEASESSTIPAPLLGLTHYTLDSEDGYESLYRRLTSHSGIDRPALGNRRILPDKLAKSYPVSFARIGPHDERNRRDMLARVSHDWIRGVLDKSLARVARVDLTLASAPSAVENRFNLESSPELLPAGANIADVFDQHLGSLLILGAPGSGKTTLLLELARSLIARAREDGGFPLPVVFGLSSWARRQLPITAWMIDELNERYDVPRKLGEAWVEAGQVLPLLDGLDEVAGEHREACVCAINHFRRENGPLPIVVCSRTADYEDLRVRLRLPAAVVIQPLTRVEIAGFVERGGEPFKEVRSALDRDPELLELLDTPLMLDIARVALEAKPYNAFAETGTTDVRRDELLKAYVDAMFRRRAMPAPHAKENALRWLSFLAGAMRCQGQTAFHLESLRPDWLSAERQRRLAAHLIWMIPAFLGMLLFWISDAIFVSLFGRMKVVALGSGVIGGSASAIESLQDPFNPVVQALFGGGLAILAGVTVGRALPQLAWSRKVFSSVVLKGTAWGLVAGARTGLVAGAISGPLVVASLFSKNLAAGLALAPLGALVVALLDSIIFSAVGGIAGLIVGAGLAVAFGSPADLPGVLTSHWSGRGVTRGLRKGAKLGSLAGLIAGLLAAVAFVAFQPVNTGQTPPLYPVLERIIGAVIAAALFGAAGAVLGVVLGLLSGGLAGLLFLAPHTPSIRQLLSKISVPLRSSRSIRPVDSVRWRWRPRTAFGGAIQLGLWGVLLGLPVTSLLSAAAAVLRVWLTQENLDTLFGPVQLSELGFGGRLGLSLEATLLSAFAGGLMGAVFCAVTFAPLGFVEGTLAGTELETRAYPNQGTVRSARTALLAAVWVGLACAMISVPIGLALLQGQFWIFGSLDPKLKMAATEKHLAFMLALFGAQFGIVVAGIRNGGLFCIQHLVVRALLWRSSSAPLRYTRFLDYAAGPLGFLHKVGGGYIFVHRFVLEYFAARS